jgi:hypothetical protein
MGAQPGIPIALYTDVIPILTAIWLASFFAISSDVFAGSGKAERFKNCFLAISDVEATRFFQGAKLENYRRVRNQIEATQISEELDQEELHTKFAVILLSLSDDFAIQVELAITACGRAFSSRPFRPGLIGKELIASSTFELTLLRRCVENQKLRKKTNCALLSHRITDLSRIRCENSDSCNGGGASVEARIVRSPEVDPILRKYMSWFRDHEELFRDIEREDRVLTFDLWKILKSSLGTERDERITASTASAMFYVLSLFSNSDVDAANIGAQLIRQGQLRRYIKIFPDISNNGASIPGKISYAKVESLFGLTLPDPYRSYHAISGAVQGCALREMGYGPELIAEAVYEAGLVYEWYAYFMSDDYTRDKDHPSKITADRAIWNPAKASELLKGAPEEVRNTFRAAVNDAEKHRLGAAFAANLCKPIR